MGGGKWHNHVGPCKPEWEFGFYSKHNGELAEGVTKSDLLKKKKNHLHLCPRIQKSMYDSTIKKINNPVEKMSKELKHFS